MGLPSINEQMKSVIRSEIISQPGITKTELIILLKMFEESQVTLIDFERPSE